MIASPLSFPAADDLERWDREDPLREHRTRFALPDGIIYLDGNSLGALPRATAERVAHTLEHEWGRGLVRSWNEAGWIGASGAAGGKLAALIGARPNEVTVADSTSVNLFKLLVAGVRLRPERRAIVSETGNFPTDLYIAQGVAETLPGVELRAVPREQVPDAITGDVAVVLLTHVHYRTGERFDMDAVTRAAQAQGALMLWDLSHSAGAVEVDLNGAGADLAVGCGYKYLNGGPGAPAFLFAAERHHAALRSPLTGWMGHAAPFAFPDAYAAGDGMARFLCGTPPILGMASLEAGLDLFLTADRAALFAKAERLCSLFIALVEARCAGMGLTLVTPRDPTARGSHVSFAHAEGYAVMHALIADGVIGDFRAPDILRFGFAPLYVGYRDVARAVDVLHRVLSEGRWRDVRRDPAAVVT